MTDSNSAATQDEGKDEADVCALCCQKRSTITVCGECKEHLCAEYIDLHTCGDNNTVCRVCREVTSVDVGVNSHYFALCNVVCREGLWSTLVYLGGFSRGG